MWKRLSLALAGLMLVTACGGSDPLRDMEKGERGRVVRIIDGDALVLDTGQSVRLVGIEAPAMNRRSREPAPYAEEASRTLEDLVMGREVRLYYPGLTRDRYDRALAHVQTADARGEPLWVNEALVRRGAARVRMYPDTSGAGEALFAAEDIAREEKLGLWALKAYQPVEGGRLPGETRGFMLVTGTLGEEEKAEERSGQEAACLRALRGASLIVRIERTAAELCDVPAGGAVELRGWVSGGEIEINHPLHLRPIRG